MIDIKPANVAAVLLPDGWHEVHGATFTIDTAAIASGGWKKAAHWEEAFVGRGRLYHLVTVPFESVLGVRELKK
jgi:hypothetical protein